MTTVDRSVPGAADNAPGREFHAVANLFPLMRGAAFQELVADIKKNGLLEPILCDAKGRILDGRNRYRACLEAGVEPRFVCWEGDGTLEGLSLSLNLKRRHLDESQRAMVAARLARMLRGRRRPKRANLPACNLLRPRDKAAAAVNVSPRLVQHALKVLQRGCTELIAAVETGEVPVSAGSTLAAQPLEQQAEIVAGGAKRIAQAARDLRAGRTATAARPAGRFGVAGVEERQHGEIPGEDTVVFLWVTASGLAGAIEALKARGFCGASEDRAF